MRRSRGCTIRDWRASRPRKSPRGKCRVRAECFFEATAATAMSIAAAVRLFTRATSLGGPHSLIEHRASIEGRGTKTPQNLLRCSIGLEHPDDLIADLEQALEKVR